MPPHVGFIPSRRPEPVPWTGNPVLLVWQDVKLFFKFCANIPGTIMPLMPFKSGEMDELYPSFRNLFDLALHLFLVITQLLFLLSLPLLVLSPIPFGLGLLYLVGFVVVNKMVCWILNRNVVSLPSKIDIPYNALHDSEHWVFLNGVSVGKHWLQSNVDRVHNPTDGIIFDIIQCLIQRDFSYATQDIRNAYQEVKKALLDPKYKKVVFIIHSQGGIEGGMIVDWLLNEVPQDLLSQLEVYSFGNAAGHFNNPHKRGEQSSNVQVNGDRVNGQLDRAPNKVIRHIEHYANEADFVSQWGVLNFANLPNRYMGHVFVRPGSGHMLNQHYLDYMFPLADGKKTCADENEFMEMELYPHGKKDVLADQKELLELWMGDTGLEGKAWAMDVSSPDSPFVSRKKMDFKTSPTPKVKDLSRLWAYRNGMSPKD